MSVVLTPEQEKRVDDAFNAHYKCGGDNPNSPNQRRKRNSAKVHFTAGWEAYKAAQQKLIEENARGGE